MTDDKPQHIATERFVAKMLESFTDWQIERFVRCFTNLGGRPRKQRLAAIIALSAELDRIRTMDIFGTAFGETAIENVINGDKEAVGCDLEWFLFRDPQFHDDRDRAIQVPRWARFRELLQMALVDLETMQ